MATLSTDIGDFTRRDFTFGGVTKPVLTVGERGPAVIVLHEIFGFTPPLARFCRWVADAGMRVYAPILLGTPDATNRQHAGLGAILRLCISREFTLFRANRASPVVDWLKPLARQAHTECGGPGVGVIGMCLTGGFGLAMAVDPVVLAPALSQPSMPPRHPHALDLDPAGLACVKDRARDGLEIRAYRFAGDTLAHPERFDTLRMEFGNAFKGTTLPDSSANPDGPMARRGKPPHSVMTGDLIDAPGEPTRQAADDVIAFFKARLVA